MLLKAVFRRVGRGQPCGGFRALGLEGRWGVAPGVQRGGRSWGGAPGRSCGSGRGADAPGLFSPASRPLIFCLGLPLARSQGEGSLRIQRWLPRAWSSEEQGGECSGQRSEQYPARNHPCENQAGEMHLCISAQSRGHLQMHLISGMICTQKQPAETSGKETWPPSYGVTLPRAFIPVDPSIHQPVTGTGICELFGLGMQPVGACM